MTGPVARISARVLADRLASGETLVVLDVRENHERAFAAIPLPPSAVDLHVPMGSIPSRIEEIREAVANAPAVVYCHHGVRSLRVIEWLTGQGVGNASNLEGGIDAWSTSVDPGVPRY